MRCTYACVCTTGSAHIPCGHVASPSARATQKKISAPNTSTLYINAVVCDDVGDGFSLAHFYNWKIIVRQQKQTTLAATSCTEQWSKSKVHTRRTHANAHRRRIYARRRTPSVRYVQTYTLRKLPLNHTHIRVAGMLGLYLCTRELGTRIS